jgi:hypothetical protein
MTDRAVDDTQAPGLITSWRLRTGPRPRPKRHPSVTAVVFAYLMALAALVAALIVAVLYFSSKGSETGQIEQLGHMVSTQQTTIGQLQQSKASLSQEVTGLESLVGQLSPFTAFTGRCSGDFTGPNGVDPYEIPCIPNK